MKGLIQLLVLSVGLAGLFFGCSEKIEPKPITYSQLLTGTTSKTWRIVSFEQVDDGQASGVIPIQGVLNACRADDQFIFYADEERKFQWSNGSSRCATSEPDTVETSWLLVNSNASIAFFMPLLNTQGSLLGTIKNLTNTSMTVEYYFDDINASYRFTFNSTTK